MEADNCLTFPDMSPGDTPGSNASKNLSIPESCLLPFELQRLFPFRSKRDPIRVITKLHGLDSSSQSKATSPQPRREHTLFTHFRTLLQVIVGPVFLRPKVHRHA